ncbi:MAG TPA: hypothetical protein O0X32_01995 [Methanocorpusculum sp.]|nr:hypothetical protein [Methanocorpusculum sp.]
MNSSPSSARFHRKHIFKTITPLKKKMQVHRCVKAMKGRCLNPLAS